ncbi:MAG: hypothetical protein ACRYG7_21060 [Janthinobacterium lividum]
MYSGSNITLLAVLTGTLFSVNGAVTGEVFATYLDKVLGPEWRPGDVVVLDNLEPVMYL